MKKIFLTFATAALLSVNVFAADGGKKGEAAATASYAVQQEFASDFSGAANVTWTITKNVQKADFTIDGARKTAFYNLSGDFLGTTQVVTYSAIPAKTQKLIADNYKGYTVGAVIVYQTNEAVNDNIDPTSYFVELKNADHQLLVRVTSEGKVDFFKQVK
jgi:hypothetical protein